MILAESEGACMGRLWGYRPWALVMQEKGLASGELGTHVGVLALGARGRKRPPGLFGLQKKVRKVGLNGSGP